jgi:hypothetical protein
MILQIMIGGRFRQAHAFAGEVQAFLIGCYAATPIWPLSGGSATGLSATGAWFRIRRRR